MTPENGKQTREFRPQRVAELVADELRRQIITGELETELPREEILLERYQVSRPSLREAFRILETEGLIQVRRGRVGGAEIRLPSVVGAAYQLGLVLQSKNVHLADLAHARLVIEPACAEMAAAADDPAAIAAELEQLIAENEALLETPSREFTESAQRFHEGITRLCGNVTLSLLAAALETDCNIHEQHWAEEATTEGSYPDADQRLEVIKAHKAIARRIGKGDGAGASRAMRSHLEVSQPFVDLRDVPLRVVGTGPRG
jgi:GntR family transcriptional regulator, transcriptional repressor for pyruvate dehydrogenase complex